MTLYRDHRGSLDASMATVQDLTLTELILHAHKVIGTYEDVGEVEVKKYGPEGEIDERIGWDTYIVNCNGSVLGFTNGPFDEENI